MLRFRCTISHLKLGCIKERLTLADEYGPNKYESSVAEWRSCYSVIGPTVTARKMSPYTAAAQGSIRLSYSANSRHIPPSLRIGPTAGVDQRYSCISRRSDGSYQSNHSCKTSPLIPAHE
ncbi:hypothetical protein NEOLEDRAFT_198780 [Neolentinus lepideus HHB14362 ss-1]|uniref:Uncharacterized protein n=1 Tax=Neolentinus lepideus HHB14362 ss-1 TaxID=1314782 RepID=A0A165TH45_9AGAM|nr:hypothetical protein NEOLEDRAFT_198780 [Neolentinus lepideus HHB14362 ss-1]